MKEHKIKFKGRNDSLALCNLKLRAGFFYKGAIMAEDKKEFTGVWIPKHIIEDERLKPVARLIYAEIACFSVCTMTNETLAQRAGCSEATASRVVGVLKELGYVKIVGFNGRIRKMTSLYDKPIPPSQNDEAAYAKSTKQPTQNESQENNIDNKEITGITKVIGETPLNTKKDIDDMFLFWSEHIGYDITSRIKANRYACNNLLKKYKVAGVKQPVSAVEATQSDRYAPRISDFSSLQSKLNELISWAKKKGTTNATARF